MQFGAGPELAAQCQQAPTPDGWRPWFPDADDPIPDALSKRAQAVASDQSIPLGATESYPLPGVVSLIRVEPRVWGHDAQGALVEGCFRASGIYLPSETPPAASAVTAPEEGKMGKIVTALTAASLAAGTIATVVSIRRKQ